MKSKIIQVHEGQPVIGSWALSEGTNIHHCCILRIFKRREKSFASLGKVVFLKRYNGKKGRQIQEYILNVPQTKLMIDFMSPVKNELMIQIKTWNAGENYSSDLKYFKELENFFDI